MPADYDELDDVYVADLLKREAKSSSSGNAISSLHRFPPNRAIGAAPKLNTRFLRNILKETDSHNSALLAKEQREARLKQSELGRREEVAHRERRYRKETDDRPRDEYHSYKRRRRYSASDEDRSGCRSQSWRFRGDDDDPRRSRHHHRDDPLEHCRDRMQSQQASSSKESGRREDVGSGRRRRREGKHAPEENIRSSKNRQRTSRQHYESRSRSPSTRRGHERHEEYDRRTFPRQKQSPSAVPDDEPDGTNFPSRRKQTSRSHHAAAVDSDSDPLDVIVGPAPPPRDERVQVRGRGTVHSSSLVMDSHFNADYNPADDAQPNSETDDDWDQALEALRDRQRWKQQGAERLRSAGFTDSEIKKWEKGDQKDEEDVRWTKRGEDREWDRGKVMDSEGNIELKPSWVI